MLVYGSVCSGIEAATVAWHLLGWRPAFFAEIEPFPCFALHHHYGCGRPVVMPSPDDTSDPREAQRRAAAIKAVAGLPERPAPGAPGNAGDFTTIMDGQYEPIDVLVGGTPCQDFSIAGLRAGMAGDRGNLTLQFLTLARRLRPKWVVWENVPGVLSSNGGRDFGSFLGGLGELGYGWAYRTLDAQFFGVPQRRRRVFVVGHLGDWRRAAAVLFERHSLQGHPPPRREAGQGIAGALAGVSDGGGWRVGADEAAANQLVGTLTAKHGNVGSTDARTNRIIPQTATALRARDGKRSPDSDCTATLLAFGGNNTSGPIEVATALNACHSASGRMDFETETFIAHTLRGNGFDASEDGTGRGTPLVPVAFNWQAGGTQAHLGFDPDAGVSGTLHVGQTPAIAFTENQRNEVRELAVAGALSAIRRGDAKNETLLATAAVRRLTPRECERLQGFPDGYTLIPMVRATLRPGAEVMVERWRRIDDDEAAYLADQGCKVSRRGRARRWYTTAAADGPRYKALGNSMAVPVMHWIGARIQMVEELA